MPLRTQHRVFPAKIEDLETMIVWIRSTVRETIVSEADRRKVELAMEEALVNVIFHAYPRHARKAMLEIIIQNLENHTLAFKIIDKGLPFNPLLQRPKQFNPKADLEKREEGGLGILFIQKCMDEVHYERHHPFNILTLIKKS